MFLPAYRFRVCQDFHPLARQADGEAMRVMETFLSPRARLPFHPPGIGGVD